MRPNAKSIMALAAASAAAIWGASASAASERIVCEQDPSHPSMSDCVLISPASQASATGSPGPSSPDTVTYYVIEPMERQARDVVVMPEGQGLAVTEAEALSEPPRSQPFPDAGNEPPRVQYVVAESSLPPAGAGKVMIIPAQRLIVHEPPPFASAEGGLSD